MAKKEGPMFGPWAIKHIMLKKSTICTSSGTQRLNHFIAEITIFMNNIEKICNLCLFQV